MSDRILEIKISKALLVIPESELLRCLPPDILTAALKRGKAIKRHRQQANREKEKFGSETSSYEEG